ncbi:ligand-binding domain of nuclear hormone receptor domain-containing protein [Ditylenchus destructor]|uniref:Ligand-binding domain of nuclear hormone receptor domain-containing protein n=1 Tax=Ditylenchus destructor TaxID=166010 RepID=A0AAD4MJ50_9BILA|nr:ligand-binding domain of nuclear hormone receptor domain-containing protein [Ditylenchus destructor]
MSSYMQHSGVINDLSSPQDRSPNDKNQICLVCSAETDDLGWHFGQFTCRACAAFFRRTLILKLRYTCKRDQKCKIEKGNRNMCRSCRFTKCLGRGMVIPGLKYKYGRYTNSKQWSSSSLSNGQCIIQPQSKTSNGKITAQDNTNQSQDPIRESTLDPTEQKPKEMKYLSRMLEGYQNFVSLREASYKLFQESLPIQENDISQSNFAASKTFGFKVEASLVMDTVENYFTPFKSLSSEDKNRLFDSYYCVFSNTERAFRTYKSFAAGDDRLFMQDGGCAKLSQFEKFYEKSCSYVTGYPMDVARTFKPAMDYLLNVVVAEMRKLEITEVELMVLLGMFLWKDSDDGVTSQGNEIVREAKNNILADFHNYYHTSLGLFASEITVKTANLLLLVPKIEKSVKMMKEAFDIAKLFNLMQLDSCCRKIDTIRV